MMNPLELPPDFIHEPPKGFHYEVDQFRRNVHRICIVNDGTFSILMCGTQVRLGDSINTKTGEYFAPINFSKQGDKVDIKNTRPYSAMQLNT